MALAIAASISLSATIRRVTIGPYVPSPDLLDPPSRWWPWGHSPIVVWLIDAVGIAVYLIFLVTIVRHRPRVRA